MNKGPGHYTAPGVFFFAFAAVTQVAGGLYLAAELEPRPILFLVTPLGLLWAAACWLQRDLHARGLRWSLDVGFVLYVAGVVLIPYYLLKTRGPRALLVIFGFLAVYYISQLIGAALYILLTSQ